VFPADLLRTHWTRRGARERERDAVDTTNRMMVRTGRRAWPITKRDEVGGAMALPILHACPQMLAARERAARAAALNLVHREDGVWLVGTLGPVRPADEAARAIRAAHVRRAVNLTVHGAPGLMVLANNSIATGTPRDLVGRDDLARAALAVADALRAETSLPARCFGG
jgi:hypothetical protein